MIVNHIVDPAKRGYYLELIPPSIAYEISVIKDFQGKLIDMCGKALVALDSVGIYSVFLLLPDWFLPHGLFVPLFQFIHVVFACRFFDKEIKRKQDRIFLVNRHSCFSIMIPENPCLYCYMVVK